MAIQKEIWQNAIVEGFFADNSFMSKSTNDDMYVEMGKKVHIPNAGAASNIEVDRAEVPATGKKRDDRDVEYTLHELTTDPVFIPNADIVELSYDKRNSVISTDRKGLISKAGVELLYCWTPASISEENTVRTSGAASKAYTASATGNRKKMTKADVLALMTKFNADDIPQEDRYLLLDAQMYAQLLDDLTNTELSAFLASADAQKGILGRLFSFNIMQRSQVLRYATSGSLSKWSGEGAATDNAAGLAWQIDCVSRALGEIKIFSKEDDPTYYGDIYSFLVRVGGANRRTDHKGVCAIVQDSEA